MNDRVKQFDKLILAYGNSVLPQQNIKLVIIGSGQYLAELKELVVIDGGGSPTQIADDIAQQTWESKGVRTTTINQLISELVASWATEDGMKVMPILFEEIMSKIGTVNE